jgi:hypothetical protein
MDLLVTRAGFKVMFYRWAKQKLRSIKTSKSRPIYERHTGPNLPPSVIVAMRVHFKYSL